MPSSGYRRYCADPTEDWRQANKDSSRGQVPFYRHKWGNLSEYVKDIKQNFSRYYNKNHERKGYFWSDRFKSVLVEDGDTLINLLAYGKGKEGQQVNNTIFKRKAVRG
jgi:hypothetical protein